MNTFRSPEKGVSGLYTATYKYDELCLVLQREDIEMARKMLEAGADIEAKNCSGYTPLQYATDQDLVDKVKLLIDYGADVRAVHRGGDQTPLHIASMFDKGGETAQLLIDGGANIESRDPVGHTPLLGAAETGCLSAAKVLILNGADVNVFDRNRLTALHSASSPWNWHETTPLHFASDNASFVELLINNGANVNALSHNGLTSLHLAILGGHAGIVSILIEKSADMGAITQDGRTVDDMIKSLYRKDPEAAVLIQTEVERARALRREAFAMGYNGRLGLGTLVNWLSGEELRMVLRWI
jgi:ankyrin repeat protein